MSVLKPKLTRQLSSTDGAVSFATYEGNAMMIKPVGAIATFTALTHNLNGTTKEHPDVGKTFVQDEEYWGAYVTIHVNAGTVIVYTYGLK